MKRKKLSPVHPGKILMEEFFNPLGVTQYRVAKDIHVPARRINEVIHGTRSISAGTALRLGLYFRMSPQSKFFGLTLKSYSSGASRR